MDSSANVKLPKIDNAPAGTDAESFQAKNWKSFSKKELQKFTSQEKSRYLAYEAPSKSCKESMSEACKRLRDLKKMRKRQEKPPLQEEVIDNEIHIKLMGQLKAAEARNRIRLMRLRYINNRGSEVNHLISCQPTALKAVRLQSLVPPNPDQIDIRDCLVKNERSRVNALLEDETGLETARLLT